MTTDPTRGASPTIPGAREASPPGTRITAAPGKRISVKLTPLSTPSYLAGRVGGVSAAECSLQRASGEVCFAGTDGLDVAAMSQDELVRLEATMRDAALSTGGLFLLGLDAMPVADLGGGKSLPLLAPPAGDGAGSHDAAGNVLAGATRAGIYQLMTFPISRFNGIPLPPDSRIRFSDPSRWLQGGMESRLFTISMKGSNKFFSWDAHAPVGKTNHAFYHVNQKGMFSLFSQADHAALTGTALIQAKQLRYLKVGGRLFLVVGVIVDGVQLAGAAEQSLDQKSAKPLAAQTIRTAGSWALAWAGAKAGVAAGALAGIETGPGVVLTAVGGGMFGGVAGYMGADWVADWIYAN